MISSVTILRTMLTLGKPCDKKIKVQKQEGSMKRIVVLLLFTMCLQLSFWPAVTLAASGHVEKSLPLFKKVFSMDENWAILLLRLTKAGQLPDDSVLIQ